jgi:hypothetical protein
MLQTGMHEPAVHGDARHRPDALQDRGMDNDFLGILVDIDTAPPTREPSGVPAILDNLSVNVRAQGL